MDVRFSDGSESAANARGKRAHLIFGFCILAVALLGVWLDVPVARWMSGHPVDKHSSMGLVLRLLKWPGDVRFTLAVVALLGILFQWRGLRTAGHIALAGLLGGGVYLIIKWIVGRRRPDKASGPYDLKHFPDGIRGIMTAENLSFPSGHVTLAFATAAALGIHFPRGRWWFLGGASLVAVERIRENAHYLTDVIAGALLGTFCAHVVAWIFAAVEHRRSSSSGGDLDANLPLSPSAARTADQNV